MHIRSRAARCAKAPADGFAVRGRQPQQNRSIQPKKIGDRRKPGKRRLRAALGRVQEEGVHRPERGEIRRHLLRQRGIVQKPQGARRPADGDRPAVEPEPQRFGLPGMPRPLHLAAERKPLPDGLLRGGERRVVFQNQPAQRRHRPALTR